MFWKNYFELCATKNQSPNAIAKELQISSGSVSEWKKGRIPSKNTLQKLAQYFNVSVEYFFIDHQNITSEKPVETFNQLESDQFFIAYQNASPEIQAAVRKLLDL